VSVFIITRRNHVIWRGFRWAIHRPWWKQFGRWPDVPYGRQVIYSWILTVGPMEWRRFFVMEHANWNPLTVKHSQFWNDGRDNALACERSERHIEEQLADHQAAGLP